MAGDQATLTPDQQRLVEEHAAWAVDSPINSYRRAWRDDQDELEALARFGLVKAALTFNPARGVLFTTWASTKIRSAVLDGRRLRMRNSQGDARMRNGRARKMRHYPVKWPTDDRGQLVEFPSQVNLDRQVEYRLALRRLRVRNKREARIVRAYLAGYENAEIGRLIGRSRSRIDQILRRIGIPAQKAS